MIIAFHNNRLDVRGSCDAMYNYAKYSEEIYGHTSIIFAPLKEAHEPEGVDKFVKRFKVVYYTNLEDSLSENNCDVLYVIKYGKVDNIHSTKIPNLIHCVFSLEEPHGDLYIAVSKSLAEKYGKKDYLPHMVGMKPILHSLNLRDKLNIPHDAVVIGRHGGMDTFNLSFVHNSISEIVRDNKNIYFLLLNTPCFDNHPQIIHLQRTSDLSEKEMFINTCDLGLEASTLGHTFGLSCAEFSVNNKPMLIYNGQVWNRAHIDIMDIKGLYFSTPDTFKNTILFFNKNTYNQTDLNAYREYSITKVMKMFNECLQRAIFNFKETRQSTK